MTDHDAAPTENAPAGTWQTTTINPKWLVKFIVFFVVAFGIGVWGAYDAFVAYPARGQYDAEWKLRLYLEQAEQSRRMFDANVLDPAEALTELQAAPESDLNTMQLARREWLDSLSLVESLDGIAEANIRAAEANEAGEPFEDTATYFANPQQKLSELATAHATASTPKPLTAFDIPVQFLIMFVGCGAGLWILLAVIRKKGVSYRYEASTMTLELNDGRKVTPAMIEDVDKRQWHKFYCTLHFVDGSKAAKLDLYVHVPLEEWVLEMEPHTPNYEPEPELDEAAADDEVNGPGALDDAADPADDETR